MTLKEIDTAIRDDAKETCKAGGIDYTKDLTFEEQMNVRASIASMMQIQLLQTISRQLAGTIDVRSQGERNRNQATGGY